ncbi:GNAT family N-acetyltransferase [Herbaspirillum sp. alder98]|uniref:GNAT family N-acetyltransferase n=1 Tax=Herbaspirillum sp. alder98 TaxID=2913096 RepID=UPI001CD8DD39|nr:GNAT family N-acetyltransferase [Herbaspirillum sp. alder98]MCA1326881.1 GNAT family N-acetyltransferase [Herbaspirillum sp. alder98]
MPAIPSSTHILTRNAHEEFTTRPLTTADITACHQLSQQLQWPHRLQDWQFLQSVGHGLVVEMHRDDAAPAVVGTALHFNLGQQHASFGMVIVQPAMQGHGLGRRLMQALLERTRGRVRLLNATEAGQPLYEKLGFVATGTTHQHQGAHLPPVSAPLPDGARLRPFVPTDIARIKALDAIASGMDRGHILEALGGLADGIVIERAGEMTGFALIRPFGHGHLVGPVVAPDIAHAKALITHWVTARAGDFIRIDVFATAGLSAWLIEIGLAHVDSIVPMRLGQAPAPSVPDAAEMQLFSVIAQAVG